MAKQTRVNKKWLTFVQAFGAFYFVLEEICFVTLAVICLSQMFQCGGNHKSAVLSILPFYIFVKKTLSVIYGQTLRNALLVIKASAPTNTLFTT